MEPPRQREVSPAERNRAAPPGLDFDLTEEGLPLVEAGLLRAISEESSTDPRRATDCVSAVPDLLQGLIWTMKRFWESASLGLPERGAESAGENPRKTAVPCRSS
ncbi:MAG: hypothetical protein R3C12_20230 [Planctomycetaceae bacterium]